MYNQFAMNDNCIGMSMIYNSFFGE